MLATSITQTGYPNHTGNALATNAAAAKLYQNVALRDSDRMVGTVPAYNSFDDFVTTFHKEADDPNIVGAADVLDVINPLQHLPLVSNIYRQITGDKIKPGADMIGGTLFGGAIGLATSSMNAVVTEKTGHDVSENIAKAFSGEQSFVAKSSATQQDSTLPNTALAISGSDAEPTNTKHPAQNNTEEWIGEPVTITWNQDSETAVSTKQNRTNSYEHQRVASAYGRIASAQSSSNKAYELVYMRDPERMAGSFARYA